MEKNFKLKVTEDMINDIQTYKSEIDARTYVIDSMFENHKDDKDNAIFISIPFKHYQRELFEYKMKYEKAIEELGSKLIPMVQEHVGKEKVNFDWTIEDFSKLEVEIYMK